ncbi:MAG: uroporphyrinogen decarboxylase family protein [Phycisphaerae bacterium]
MTKRERVEAVLRGRRPDCPPVSFWHHFEPHEITGQAALDAHLRHLETYDLDFLKVMNDHHYPRGDVNLVQSVADLRKIKPLPGDAGQLAGQLDLLRGLRKRLGNDLFTCTTIFSAWTVLRTWVVPPSHKHGPPKIIGEDQRDDVLTRLLQEDRSAVKAAVRAIGEMLAAFARECVAAGASGIFLSVRDDWVDRPANGEGVYDEIVMPTDMAILDAVKDAPFNVLHVCGRPMLFERFADYPVAVINWADRAAGPSIAYACEVAGPAIAGGVDNLRTLPQGKPEDCAAEVRDALRQAGNRPIFITPGCTYDPKAVPAENLRATVSAARGG